MEREVTIIRSTTEAALSREVGRMSCDRSKNVVTRVEFTVRSLRNFVEENGYRLHVTTHSNPSAPNCLSRFTLLRFGERLEGNILSALQRDTHHLFSTEQTYSPKDIDMSSRGFGRGGGRSPGGRSPGGRGRGGFGGRGGDGGGRFGRDEGPPAEIVGA